ncbi:hypothetical protein D9615_003503 [Tricholomella constricta]|uniref:Uncharacterized protein n=1 Tax=Tricholomella constricta TaxID=117010 RepID=A0A8H5M7M5_9AGAR|nr:hypothetical protein D9615_003503 [Tricholomella constricta]
MYSTAPAYSYASFSSSPPSSPAPYIDSSSPPSSPGLDSCNIHSDDEIHPISLAHPFAASAKANWHPPLYEKKRPSSPITPPPTIKKPRLCQPAPRQPQPSPIASSSSSPSFMKASEPTEEDIWDDASTKVVDEGHGAVTLDNQRLTHIPESFIRDLAKFCVLPESSELINSTSQSYRSPTSRSLSRVATAPASSTENGPRVFLRTRSAAAQLFGLPREKVQLFLSSNAISVLPLSLLSLENLSVLSIRSNNLTCIPPEIVGLKNLEDLNIAQNKIEYLPAEMLQMSLKRLQVHPNHFIAPPPSDRPLLRTSIVAQATKTEAASRRPVSTTLPTTLPRILPLVELLLRTLLSPSGRTSEVTILERYYILPLAEYPVETSESSPDGIHFPYPLPSHIRKVLHACLPGSVDVDSEDSSISTGEYSVVTRIDLCPSPKHQQLVTGRVFVRHAEERFTWEKTIANVDVGGLVPMRWRGCQLGCLDFLDPPKDKKPPANDPGLGRSDEDCSMVVDDHDLEGVVQVVDLGTGRPGGLDDFDDD